MGLRRIYTRGLYSDFIYGHFVVGMRACISTVRKKKITTKAIIFTKSHSTKKESKKKKKKWLYFSPFFFFFVYWGIGVYKNQIQFFVYTSDFHFLPPHTHTTQLQQSVPSLSSSAALFFITDQPTDFKRIYYPEPRTVRPSWGRQCGRVEGAGRGKKGNKKFRISDYEHP